MPTYSRRLQVPVENCSAGRQGHQIAFNILNVGRYKLASSAIGGARNSLRDAFAMPRTASPSGSRYPLSAWCRKRLPRPPRRFMRPRLFCIVSLAQSTRLSRNSIRIPHFTQDVQRRIEEFAVECSILKVFGSEMVERVVDRTLQIHGIRIRRGISGREKLSRCASTRSLKAPTKSTA